MAANPHPHPGIETGQAPDEDTFRQVAALRRQVASVATTAREAIQAHYTDPAQLAAFIEAQGTPVCRIADNLPSRFCLWALGFEPGFIPPLNSLRYRWLRRWLGQAPIAESQDLGLFVLTAPLLTVGFLSHQLHHWLAFRAGLPGYGERSQRLYKRFWQQKGQLGRDVYKMKLEDVQALKAAIRREIEAMRFLKSLADEVLIPARQSRRIGQGKASA